MALKKSSNFHAWKGPENSYNFFIKSRAIYWTSIAGNLGLLSLGDHRLN